jgi:hypothetical protein
MQTISHAHIDMHAGMYYVCTHAWMHGWMYVCTHACMDACYVCMHACMTMVCMHVRMYVCNMYVCMHVCMAAFMYGCMYVCRHVWHHGHIITLSNLQWPRCHRTIRILCRSHLRGKSFGHIVRSCLRGPVGRWCPQRPSYHSSDWSADEMW